MMLPAAQSGQRRQHHAEGAAAKRRRGPAALPAGRVGPNFFINGIASASSQRNGPLAMRSNFCSGGQASKVLTRL